MEDRGPGVLPSAAGRPSQSDVNAEKETGWRRHGILVVSESDDRLTWPEKELVRQLGAKLYGDRDGGKDG